MNVGKYQWVMMGAVVAVIVMLGYGAMTMKDNRTGTERVGDAIHALPQGAGKAEQQPGNRTAGQKMGDSIRDLDDKNDTQSSDSE